MTGAANLNGWTDIVSVRLVRERSERLGRVRGPKDAALHLARLIPQNATQEHFGALYLDTQNRPCAAAIITVGLLNSSLVHPREVFLRAILCNAASLIVGHNHPSGDPEPSPEDVEVTRQLAEAGKLIGIPLRDHVILGEPGFVSLLERGLLFGVPEALKKAETDRMKRSPALTAFVSKMQES